MSLPLFSPPRSSKSPLICSRVRFRGARPVPGPGFQGSLRWFLGLAVTEMPIRPLCSGQPHPPLLPRAGPGDPALTLAAHLMAGDDGPPGTDAVAAAQALLGLGRLTPGQQRPRRRTPPAMKGVVPPNCATGDLRHFETFFCWLFHSSAFWCISSIIF